MPINLQGLILRCLTNAQNISFSTKYLPITIAATSFFKISGDPHIGKKVAMYSPKVNDIMATEDVRITITDVQANKKAMTSPYASFITFFPMCGSPEILKKLVAAIVIGKYFVY
jgi:hypothetical protein